MVPIRRARPVLSFATVCLIVGLTSGPVDFARAGARTDGGAPTGADWPDYGRDAGEAHFSPLSQINSENVSRLGLVSAVDLNVERVNTQPIAVDGVVYVAAGL